MIRTPFLILKRVFLEKNTEENRMMQEDVLVVSCNLQKHVEISFGKAAVDSTNHMRRSPAHPDTQKKECGGITATS
jgi:hypothetical protein